MPFSFSYSLIFYFFIFVFGFSFVGVNPVFCPLSIRLCEYIYRRSYHHDRFERKTLFARINFCLFHSIILFYWNFHSSSRILCANVLCVRFFFWWFFSILSFVHCFFFLSFNCKCVFFSFGVSQFPFSYIYVTFFIVKDRDFFFVFNVNAVYFFFWMKYIQCLLTSILIVFPFNLVIVSFCKREPPFFFFRCAQYHQTSIHYIWQSQYY